MGHIRDKIVIMCINSTIYTNSLETGIQGMWTDWGDPVCSNILFSLRFLHVCILLIIQDLDLREIWNSMSTTGENYFQENCLMTHGVGWVASMATTHSMQRESSWLISYKRYSGTNQLQLWRWIIHPRKHRAGSFVLQSDRKHNCVKMMMATCTENKWRTGQWHTISLRSFPTVHFISHHLLGWNSSKMRVFKRHPESFARRWSLPEMVVLLRLNV